MNDCNLIPGTPTVHYKKLCTSVLDNDQKGTRTALFHLRVLIYNIILNYIPIPQ